MRKRIAAAVLVLAFVVPATAGAVTKFPGAKPGQYTPAPASGSSTLKF